MIESWMVPGMAQEREAAEERMALDEEERLRVEERLLREMAERYGRVIEADRRMREAWGDEI